MHSSLEIVTRVVFILSVSCFVKEFDLAIKTEISLAPTLNDKSDHMIGVIRLVVIRQSPHLWTSIRTPLNGISQEPTCRTLGLVRVR